LKLQTFRPVPGRSASAYAKTLAPPSKPGSVPAKNAGLAAEPAGTTTRPVIAGEERRRSQRVLLRVHGKLYLAHKGEEISIEVSTVSVNIHGALLVMKQSIPLDAHVVLEHGTTRQRVPCRVARTPREMPEGYHVPLEFDIPEPNFWGIAFPPADWRPPEDL
jgi:hypothetical protein